MKLLLGCVVLVVSVACTQNADAQVIVGFSNFSVGTTFPSSTIPRTITADGIDVALSKYNGVTTSNASIVDSQLFGSPDSSLFLAANLRAQIALPAPMTDGFFFFRNSGGTNLLEVNGQVMNFTDSSLAGSATGIVGGVSVHSSPAAGSFRSVKLAGLVTSLAFIGQELTIDRIGLYPVPEPSTIMLACVACWALPFRRR